MTALKKTESQMADKKGFPLIGQAQTLVSDAAAATFAGGSVAWDGASVYPSAADATAIAADITACRTAINSILDILEAHGLMKAS